MIPNVWFNIFTDCRYGKLDCVLRLEMFSMTISRCLVLFSLYILRLLSVFFVVSVHVFLSFLISILGIVFFLLMHLL